jgi:signal transduction histidine kinase
MAGRMTIQVVLKIPSRCPLPPDAHIAFYRIAQEALDNVEKHSQAKQVTLEIMLFQAHVILYIDDDGHGFEPHRHDLQKVGLAAMHTHAQSANIALVVDSAPGKGTRVIAAWQAPGN